MFSVILNSFSTVLFDLRLLAKLYSIKVMRCYSGLYVIYIFIIGVTGTSSEGDNEVSINFRLETNVREIFFYIQPIYW